MKYSIARALRGPRAVSISARVSGHGIIARSRTGSSSVVAMEITSSTPPGATGLCTAAMALARISPYSGWSV